MRSSPPIFQDESPFLLDELPRLHPLLHAAPPAAEPEDELVLDDEAAGLRAYDAQYFDEPEVSEASEASDATSADPDVATDAELDGAEREAPPLAAAGGTLDAATRASRRTDVQRMRAAFEAGTPSKKLADLGFAARFPGRKATDSAELRAAWHELNDHVVPIALQAGAYRGPMHGDSPSEIVKLRKGGGPVTMVSPLAIWPRGFQVAREGAPARMIGAVVVHTTGRSSRSKESGYKKSTIDLVADFYLKGAIGAHYVIDLNGVIVAIADERREKGHVGWSRSVAGKGKVSYGKVFASAGWSAPAWWKAAWPGLRSPLELLPAGASHPNTHSIGIELVPLPDRTFTPEQYWALGRLLADLERRYPRTLRLSAIPSKIVLGHEDYSPLAEYEPMRVDRHGGRDPGGHSDKPVFHWTRVAAEVAAGRQEAATAAAVSRAPRAVVAPVVAQELAGGFAEEYDDGEREPEREPDEREQRAGSFAESREQLGEGEAQEDAWGEPEAGGCGQECELEHEHSWQHAAECSLECELEHSHSWELERPICRPCARAARHRVLHECEGECECECREGLEEPELEAQEPQEGTASWAGAAKALFGRNHAAQAHAALEMFAAETAQDDELFGTDEHAMLGDGGPHLLGAQRMVDAWAMQGLLDGGAFIHTGQTQSLQDRAHSLSRWQLYVPTATKTGTSPYAGQSVDPRAKWHWIAPDPVYRKPGERWTEQTLRAALRSGEALALNLGQIMFLAGDLVPSFEALKTPSSSPQMQGPAASIMAGYKIHDPYAWAVLSQLSPDPHHDLDGIEFGIDKLQRLHALQRPKEAAAKGSAAYEAFRATLKAAKRPAWARKLAGHVHLLRKARGPSSYSELHLLAQLLWRPGKLTGREVVIHAPWLDSATRATLSKETRSYDSELLQMVVTSGRYAAMALKNQDHFHPLNWAAFERELRQALQAIDAHVASAASPHPIPADAVARLAFGLHYLTDAFSAGHMRVPRQQLSADGNIASKVMHDLDGKLGLNVENGFGRRWRAFGDGFLRAPSALGASILQTLAKSGIETDPDSNLRAARRAVGTAVKQLHYHAQRHAAVAATSHVHAVLAASRGTSAEALEGDKYFPSGPVGAGKSVSDWISASIDHRVAFLAKHQPKALPEGPRWDLHPENHACLFDAQGLVTRKDFRWFDKTLNLNKDRHLKVRRPSSGKESEVLDISELYQAAKNQPTFARWAPRELKLFELFKRLPEG